MGAWRVFADRNEIEGPAGVVRLEPMAMRLLCLLAENAGRTVTRAEIVERLWDGRAVTHDAVTRQVAKLREAFGDDAREPQVVKTVPKIGFLLLVEPQRIRSEAAAADPSSPGAETPVQPDRRRRVWGVVAAALTVAAGAAVVAYARRPSGEFVAPAQHPVTAEVGRELQPALSANGAWLAYVGQPAGEPGVLYVRTLRGEARRLTPPGVEASRPAWSPDMARLAFVQKDARGCAVMVVSPLDGAIRQVGACRAADLGGVAWLDPDTLVVSDRASPEAGFRLSRLDLETGRLKPLTDSGVAGPYLGDTDPAPSADGERVFFVRTSTPGVADVYALDLAGGKVRRITRDNASIHGLTRGRDDRLVIASNRQSGASYSLWSLNARGSDWRRLTEDARAEYPSSSDGETIAFQRRDWQMGLWSAPLDAGEPQRLTATSRRDRTAAPSPDGRRLAFLSDRSGSLQLWVAEADGRAHQVSDFRTEMPREPAWSPDGRSVYLSVRTGSQFDLGRVDVATGAFQLLAHTPASERYPFWSRDGARLYFIRDEGSRLSLYERAADGRERRLVDDAVRAIEAEDGALYVQRLAAPGFWRFDRASGKLSKIGELAAVDPRSWTVAEGALWALDGSRADQLLRLDLASGAVEAVRSLPGVYPRAGLFVRDGRVVFSRVESENVDVYTVADRA
nr:winged helix-turn-helix domain-containing protein [Caulobacter sp. 17J80-11]